MNSEKRSTAAKAGWQLKKVFFAAGNRHFYAIGNDEDATVEIYSADTGELLLRERLTGGDKIDFRIRDAALLPDESALIVQFENQKCFQFGLTWSDSGKPSDQAQLSRNAFRDGQSQNPGLSWGGRYSGETVYFTRRKKTGIGVSQYGRFPAEKSSGD